MNPISAIAEHFTPAWKKTDDYRRWKAGLPSVGEESLRGAPRAYPPSNRKRWVVVSVSLSAGEYRRRRFRTRRGANLFMLARSIFYLMPSPMVGFARIEFEELMK